jgi:hypothetical protein
MKRILATTVLAIALAACSKDNFKTVPTVKIESFGPSVARNGDIIQLSATVTDQEGDLQDSVIVVRKKFNGSTLLSADSSARVSLKSLGSPVKDKIELRISISYGKLIPEYTLFQDLERDFDRNFSVGLVVIDNAGHRSDYVESDKIVLKKF